MQVPSRAPACHPKISGLFLLFWKRRISAFVERFLAFGRGRDILALLHHSFSAAESLKSLTFASKQGRSVCIAALAAHQPLARHAHTLRGVVALLAEALVVAVVCARLARKLPLPAELVTPGGTLGLQVRAGKEISPFRDATAACPSARHSNGTSFEIMARARRLLCVRLARVADHKVA